MERNPDEEEDEFLIVMQACKERKKYEHDIGKPMLKDKLSQTGWKIRQNFMKKTNALLDEKDRIDVFGGANQPALRNSHEPEEYNRLTSDSSGDCLILDYH